MIKSKLDETINQSKDFFSLINFMLLVNLTNLNSFVTNSIQNIEKKKVNYYIKIYTVKCKNILPLLTN